jgi:hypothetical protein
MILCGQCGSKVEEGMRFCADCGAQVGVVFGSEPAEPVRLSETRSGSAALRHSNDAVTGHTQPVAHHTGGPAINPVSQAASAELMLRAQTTSRTIVLTVLATVSLLGLGGIITWASLASKNGNQDHDILRATENQNITLTTKQNDAQPKNRPTPQPAPASASSINQEVIDALNGWAVATTRHDLEGHMSFYADTLHTYYGRKNVSASYVRSTRAPTFARYREFNVELKNISVTPDPSGTRATAVFDKSYVFRGDKEFSGSVRQMAWLEKLGSRWQITGEKDLQVYYVNR